MMSSFVVEVHDPNGRQGVLDIGGDRIMTPAYVLSDEICQIHGNTPGDSRHAGSCITQSDLWLQYADLMRIHMRPDEKGRIEDAVCNRLAGTTASLKLLHFNFFSDVSRMPGGTFVDLLRMQWRAGAGIIEIPHVFCDARMYEQAVQAALEWQQNTSPETPLMGIAQTPEDLTMLNRYLPKLGGIGIDCRRYDKSLLSRVKGTLMDQDIWVHAFSAPLQHHEVQHRGTLGMLINWFGVDTVSTVSLSDQVMGYFTEYLSRMEEQERADFMKKVRYYAPVDYSMFTFGELEVRYGGDQRLSHFCDCPICRNTTVGDVMNDLSEFYRKNRFHRAYAYCEESQKYQRALINNETGRYIDGKPFAAEIIRRSGGMPSGLWPTPGTPGRISAPEPFQSIRDT